MPERFEIYAVCKRRYINTLPFISFPLGSTVIIVIGGWVQVECCIVRDCCSSINLITAVNTTAQNLLK